MYCIKRTIERRKIKGETTTTKQVRTYMFGTGEKQRDANLSTRQERFVYF